MVILQRNLCSTFVLVLAAGLVALPVLGARLEDLVFALPLLTSVWASIAAVSASRRRPERRAAWIWFAIACAIAAVASVEALAEAIAGGSSVIGLYLGLGASLAVVAGTAV
ncbi:MAG: hypothetical protein QOG68_1490, partial [Solirubrobacteraceae bacterium]|nr:hypothetical protein [Solirubrobacteraceae bacterium]